MGQKILIIKHGALGDMIFAQGAFAALRSHHKKDHLVLLTTPPYVSLMKAMHLFDDVWVDTRPRPLVSPVVCWRLFQKLQRGQFDHVYDLQNSKRTRLYFKTMKRFFSPSPKWHGTFEGSDFPYTDPGRKNLHIYDRHAKLLEASGIENIPLPTVDWMIGDVGALNLPEKFFLFVPGCSPTQMHKRWAPQNYGHVGRLLVQKGIIPVVVGREEEAEAIQIIQNMCPEAISLQNKTTLFDLGSLGRSAVGALGHDTGPMHIIAVTGCPSTLLFSHSSIPEHYAPRGFRAQVIHKNNLQDVSVDEVMAALQIKQ